VGEERSEKLISLFFAKPLDKSIKVWYNKGTKEREVLTNEKKCNHHQL
jgi:hypothetical protein